MPTIRQYIPPSAPRTLVSPTYTATRIKMPAPTLATLSSTPAPPMDDITGNGNITSGHQIPVWTDRHRMYGPHAEIPRFQPLKQNIAADVCVIGGGISGLSVAYECARKGLGKVVVLEDGEIASGESGRTTAHLMSWIDDHYAILEKHHGKAAAALAYQSEVAAIDRVEEIVRTENIDCDFTRLPGYFIEGHPADSSSHSDSAVEAEFAAAQRIGVQGAQLVPEVPGLGKSFRTGKAMLVPGQGEFHPTKYYAGLANAIVNKYGGSIYTHTRVKKVHGEKSGEFATVSTDNGFDVSCKSVAVATNTPFNNMLQLIDRVQPFRSYAIAATIPKDLYPKMLIWDTAEPYHYIRTTPSHVPNKDFLIVGGEDHKVGHNGDYLDRLQSLEKWTRERFPIEEVMYQWSGQVYEPLDYFPFTGRNPGDSPNIYVHTGDSGMGLTHGTLAGIIISDLMAGKPNAWADLYDPSRNIVKSSFLPEYLSHNLNMNSYYSKFITTPPLHTGDIEDLPRCSGLVRRDGIKEMAIYKDESGGVHKFSAICPHMHAVLVWNELEKSFDCPVHGSRFDCRGACVNGPAKSDLSPIAS